MVARKAFLASTVALVLVLAVLGFLLYNQVIELQMFQESKEGDFAAPPPRYENITTPLTFLAPQIRWNHMPLTVYIDLETTPPGWIPDFSESLGNAMRGIENKTGMLVSYITITNIDADIKIQWVDTFTHTNVLDAVGSTKLSFLSLDGRTLIRSAEIEMLTRTDGRQLTGNEMQNIALHELGHAFGLNHTNDKTSMMYPFVNRDVLFPSTSDAETLRQVYSKEALADLTINEAHATKRAQLECFQHITPHKG